MIEPDHVWRPGPGDVFTEHAPGPDSTVTDPDQLPEVPERHPLGFAPSYDQVR